MDNSCWTCQYRDEFDRLVCGNCVEEYSDIDGQPLGRTFWVEAIGRGLQPARANFEIVESQPASDAGQVGMLDENRKSAVPGTSSARWLKLAHSNN